MDVKQFEAFRETLQWAKDEHKKSRGAQFNMSHWARAKINDPEADLSPLANHWREIKCTSTRCLAGNAVQAHGDRFIIDAHEDADRGDAVYVSLCMDDKGMIYDIQERAQEICGLTAGESHLLFVEMAGEQWADIEGCAADIAENYGFALDLA